MFLHCLRAIDVLGAEELFPLGFKQDVGIKNGTLVTYYKAKTRNYLSRLISYSGYPYIVIFIGMIIIYIIAWWAHTKFLSKFFSFIAIKCYPSNSPIIAQSLKTKDLGYLPASYDFKQMPKYADAIPVVEKSLKDDIYAQAHLSSNSNYLESQDQLRVENIIGNHNLSKSKFGNSSANNLQSSVGSPNNISINENDKSSVSVPEYLEEIEVELH